MNTHAYQRIFYFVVFIFLNASRLFWGEQLISNKDWFVHLMICFPFLFQAIFNNKIGWLILCLLGVIHFLMTLQNAYESDEIGHFVPILILYLICGIILYFLKPLPKK
jgi:hypothetical protein